MARQALGKGLDALIPGSKAKSAQRGYEEININDIKTNPNQPRKRFTPEKLSELIASVKEKGVIEPVLVKQSGSKYELIAGERRFIAAQRAGLKSIPAVIKNVSPAEQCELALIENIQREDLNPVEAAAGFKNLMEEYKLTQEQIADRIGINRVNVANTVRILKLPAEVQQYIANGDLSFGHAKVLVGLEDRNRQKALATQVVKRGLSVRELETLAARSEVKRGGVKRTSSAEMKRVEDKLKLHFGTKVSVRGDYRKGKIEVEYYSSEDFDRILEILKIHL